MRYEYYINSEQLKLLPNCTPVWSKVFRYAKLMEEGFEFPPVKIHYNKDLQRWIYNDGRHRVMAAKLSGVPLKVKSKKILGYKG